MMMYRLRLAASDPIGAVLHVEGLVRPAGVFRRHARRARRLGLTQLYLVLSFDCDTPQDFEVAEQVHTRLAGLGVTPVYAVPGELLERGRDVYAALAQRGAEFLNHGYVEHTVYDSASRRYTSTFSYDEEPPEAVREDIVRGDAAVRDLIGVTPEGFRTPHFGNFQRPDQLRYLHGILRELGYRFSTSTLPVYGLRHGPAFDRFGLVELPVTGQPSSPLNLLDSWGFYADPSRSRFPQDFLSEAVIVARGHGDAGPGVINVYADPSQIAGSDEFFEAVASWAAVATPVGYRGLLEALGGAVERDRSGAPA